EGDVGGAGAYTRGQKRAPAPSKGVQAHDASVAGHVDERRIGRIDHDAVHRTGRLQLRQLTGRRVWASPGNASISREIHAGPAYPAVRVAGASVDCAVRCER